MRSHHEFDVLVASVSGPRVHRSSGGNGDASWNVCLNALPVSPLGAARDVGQRGRPSDHADDLGGGDRDDREVVAPPQLEGREAEQQREHHRQRDRDDEREPQRRALHGRDGEPVRAQQHEAGLAHVDQAREPEVDVQADRGERVRDRGRAQHLVEDVGEELSEVHERRPPASRCARRARGCPAAAAAGRG